MSLQENILPTFVNVGPGRCATSWMHEMLIAHPQIGMARIKETEYFNTNIEKGTNWYLEHFKHQKGKTAIGEISNNYYLDTSIPQKLLALNPDIKVIFCLRKPEGLLKSYFQFGLRRGLNFDGSLADLDTPVGRVMGSGYQSRLKQGKLVASDTPSLLESVMLSDYAAHYIKHIPAGQLFFFNFEDFKKSPLYILKELYRFLGVDSDFQPSNAETRINEAIIPKSKIIAQFGSKVAFGLRRIGAYKMLKGLHQSKLIKKLVFNSADKIEDSASLNLTLNSTIQDQLEKENNRIEKLLYDFNKAQSA